MDQSIGYNGKNVLRTDDFGKSQGGIAVSQTIYRLELPVNDGITLTCVDPRFINATRQFLRDQGLRDPFSLQLAGGAHEIAQPGETSLRLLEIIRALYAKLTTPRIVIINHEDCLWYHHNGRSELEHSKDDLRASAKIIRSALPEATIECYLAQLFSGDVEGKTVNFEPFMA